MKIFFTTIFILIWLGSGSWGTYKVHKELLTVMKDLPPWVKVVKLHYEKDLLAPFTLFFDFIREVEVISPMPICNICFYGTLFSQKAKRERILDSVDCTKRNYSLSAASDDETRFKRRGMFGEPGKDANGLYFRHFPDPDNPDYNWNPEMTPSEFIVLCENDWGKLRNKRWEYSQWVKNGKKGGNPLSKGSNMNKIKSLK